MQHLPQCLDAKIFMSIQVQPVVDIGIISNHRAESDAKYCISVDMAKVMLDGTSELEVAKNTNLPFG